MGMPLPKQPKETSPTFPAGGWADRKQLGADFSTPEVTVKKE